MTVKLYAVKVGRISVTMHGTVKVPNTEFLSPTFKVVVILSHFNMLVFTKQSIIKFHIRYSKLI